MKICLNILLIIFLTYLLSCQNSKVEKDIIIGKWKGYNFSENEYFELDVNENTIGSFSHYGGNGGLREYRIAKDSLFFNETEFKMEIISKNQFTLTSSGEVDTLTRLPDSIFTYHTIQNYTDSTFNLFYKQFESRAKESWIKNNYVPEKELKKSIIKEEEIKEDIIMIDKNEK